MYCISFKLVYQYNNFRFAEKYKTSDGLKTCSGCTLLPVSNTAGTGSCPLVTPNMVKQEQKMKDGWKTQLQKSRKCFNAPTSHESTLGLKKNKTKQKNVCSVCLQKVRKKADNFMIRK